MANVELPYNWTPRLYQMNTWQFFMNGGKRAAAVWHRRAGKDLFAINLCATMMALRPGLYWHVLPTYKQGRQIVWEGFTKEGRKFISHFPKEIIESVNNTEMRIKLKTGSTYQVIGGDDPDRLVGTNPVGVVMSEYSLHNPKVWDLLRPILAENEGWAFFIYTPRGKNHGFRMFQQALKHDKWHAEKLIAGDAGTKRPNGEPVISDEIIDDERMAGMSESLIKQEFYCSFEAPIEGAYYANEFVFLENKKRIGSVPWEPLLPVNTAWDLGMGDATAIWFWQEVQGEIRVIDYLENSGEALRFYANELGKKPYTYGRHYLPHDAQVRELGTGKTRKEMLMKLGIKSLIVKRIGVADGIEAVRATLPRCYFDEENCGRGIDALRSYHKELDEAKSDGSHNFYKDKPKHDWTSHGADAFRYLATTIKIGSHGKKMSLQTQMVSTKSYI